jgi:hypothetical protein
LLGVIANARLKRIFTGFFFMRKSKVNGFDAFKTVTERYELCFDQDNEC